MLLLLASSALALTVANPVPLSYRFQPSLPSRREAADPTVIFYKGEFWLFLSKSGGYYHSQDLVNWIFVKAQAPLTNTIEAYAPTALVIDDVVYYLASEDARLYKSSNPKDGGSWTIAQANFPQTRTDPCLFQDDDGRVYYYGGSSDTVPIIGCEINPKTWTQIGTAKNLIYAHHDQFGWERKSDYNTDNTGGTWVEGPWMNKIGKTYYLQYANPGATLKCYNDAVYTSSSPLGPFTIANHNPFSYRPEGFVAAAGHGSTFNDTYGNLWHVGTQDINVRHKFERRIGLYPVFHDADGTFWTYNGFGDWPFKIPTAKISGPKDLATNWYLLSYGKPVTASSSQANHPATYAVDEESRTWWAARSGGTKEEWLEIDLKGVSIINAIQANFADEGSTQLGRVTVYYQYKIEASTDGKTWTTIVDKSKNIEDLPHDYIELSTPVEAQYVRITNVKCPDPIVFSLYGLRIFGSQKKDPPAAPAGFSVTRQADARNVRLSWRPVPSALGYNIRYGVARDKQYLNYQVYGAATTSLEIRSLNKGLKYFFSIDAFNEGGVTEGNEIIQA